MIDKVLLPWDGSEAAERAVDFTARLLEKSGYRVTLLVVVEEPTYAAFWSDGMIAPEVIIPPSDDLREELKKRALEMLEGSATKLGNAGLEVETEVRFGNAAAEILRKAEEEDYDLIIMGSHGRGIFGGLLLGSVSNRVVHHAKCPVLIVRG